jgi:hypothetical protein
MIAVSSLLASRATRHVRVEQDVPEEVAADDDRGLARLPGQLGDDEPVIFQRLDDVFLKFPRFELDDAFVDLRDLDVVGDEVDRVVHALHVLFEFLSTKGVVFSR